MLEGQLELKLGCTDVEGCGLSLCSLVDAILCIHVSPSGIIIRSEGIRKPR